MNAFAAIDEWLETKRWFGTLVPQPFPSEVMDINTGSMKRGCKEVSRGTKGHRREGREDAADTLPSRLWHRDTAFYSCAHVHQSTIEGSIAT